MKKLYGKEAFLTVVVLFLLTLSRAQEASNVSANCSFDDNSFCGWSNIVQGSYYPQDQIKWKLHQGPSSFYRTGPSYDLSGSGYYVYIDSSQKFFYDEKAILISPKIKGPTALSFYYHMYGATVETLAVVVRNSSKADSTVWVRNGNQGNTWKQSGCLWIDLNGTYQVSFEATASAGITGNIAVDEIKLFDNLTRCSKLLNTKQTSLHLSANCSFDGSFCGWRDLSSKLNALTWDIETQTTPNNSELQGRSYIFTNVDKFSVLGRKKAYLISPRLSSPYCMNFLYKISSKNSKLEVVLLRQNNPVVVHKAWECIKCNNSCFETGRASLSYSMEYQVLIIATPNNNIPRDIALQNVLFLPGLCENEDDNAKAHGDCDFEEGTLNNGWCLWLNEKNDVFDWTRAKGSTPSALTGPRIAYKTLCKAQVSSLQPKEGDVRLTCGNHDYEGRLEIFHANEWGTICDNDWNVKNSKVVCKQLGYSDATSIGISIAPFGKGAGRIWMDGVRCNGNESNIMLCSFGGWEVHDCSHDEDVGVVCTNYNSIQKALEGEVRLIGTSKPNTGFVQIFHENRWGFVCDDYWGIPDTTVACRQLGYTRGKETGKNQRGLTNAFFWMDDVNCKGNEKSLSQCAFSGWNKHNCVADESVVIECFLWIFSEAVVTFGTFLYIEASRPRVPGDKAHITSPWMSGDQCLTFYYHMYGKTMSCVVVYIRNEGSSDLTPLWVKSGNHGTSWYRANVNINRNRDKTSYQVVIEGTIGLSWKGDASLDNITFTKRACKTSIIEKTYYLSVRNNIYKFDFARKLQYNGWSDVMEFQLELTSNTSAVKPWYLYSYSAASHSILSSKLVLKPRNFPFDLVYPGINNEKRIYEIATNSSWKQEFQLSNSNFNKKCCKESIHSFDVKSVTKYDQKPSFCGIGWYFIGSSCFLFVLEEKDKINWYNVRFRCHKQNGVLAAFNSLENQKMLVAVALKFKKTNLSLYTGLQGRVKWQWINGGKMLSNFWGPGEPSGNEYCGSLLNANSWDRQWNGWLWNDANCQSVKEFICEETGDRINPVAIYPLNNVSGANESSPEPLQSGRMYNVKLKTEPFDNQYGFHYFNGLSNSFILLPNNGGLDTRYSITVMAWILPEQHGCIFSYKSGLGMWTSSSGRLTARLVFIGYKNSETIEIDITASIPWSFIAISYDYQSGLGKLWKDDRTVASRNLGANRQLSTGSDIRLGSAFDGSNAYKGRIAGLQVYDVALTDEQIKNYSRRTIEPEPIKCRSGFIPIRGKCLFISTTAVKGTDAKDACNKMSATLAIIDREYIKKELWKKLEKLIPRKPEGYFIGFEPIQDWRDQAGRQINSNMWAEGYPKHSKTLLTNAVLLTSSSLLVNSPPTVKFDGAVCQKQEVSIAHQCVTSSSSTLADSNATFAVDGILTKCFTSNKENNPYLSIKLKREAYISKVVVTKNKDCCTSPYSSIDVIAIDDTETVKSKCGSPLLYGVDEVMEFICEPPIKAKQLIITSRERNTSLVVCEIEVYPIACRTIHVVYRECLFQWLGREPSARNPCIQW